MTDLELNILTEYLRIANDILDEAQSITLRHFRESQSITIKSDQSPVTLADMACEQFIRDRLQQHFPEHGIIGEEHDDLIKDSDWQWVIDPIDGTKSFAAGNPLFGTLLGLVFQNKPVLGIIDIPALQERWSNTKGMPTQFQNKVCHSSHTYELSSARLFATTPDMFDDNDRPAFDALSAQCQYRGFGGDCYSYGLLANGFLDIVCEAQMKTVDYLALIPIIEGAGGCISDWQGNALTLQSDGTVLASANSVLHKKALQALKQTG